ncbi:hypothetical protein AB0E56_05820 [Microbacterium sp. NPDC028030]|uniref:hypothetical protein n=1 Tax=Microbacterium sp. NPDC028030 TaxID=3155124 RepID=UPI00340BE0CA
MRNRARGTSHSIAAIAGAASASAIALFCMYAEAFSWGVNRGTLLDATLTPIGYVTPTFSWTFILAEGLLCAAIAVFLVRDTVAAYRRTRLVSAAVAAAIILLIAIVSQITSPGGWALSALPLWQRGGHFLATSSAYVLFTALLALCACTKFTVLSPKTTDTPDGDNPQITSLLQGSRLP